MIRPSLRVALFATAGIALTLCACNPPSDIGTPCRLTRPTYPDGGGIQYIPVGDPAVANSNFDFLSNGDSDCENLVCVRQAGADYSQNETDGNARGECSNACIDATDCGDPAKGLQCTQLAFDATFLAQLQQSDPVLYNQYFGDATSALYCTDPNLPQLDAGF